MIYLQLFLSFFKVGILGFGGGLAIVRLVYDSILSFTTLTQEQFANIVAISQITPGPLAVNVATYVGYVSQGVLGALVATLGVSVPAFIIVSIVSRMLKQFKDSWVVQGIMQGIRPATIGLIGAAVVTLFQPAVAGEERLGAGLLAKFGVSLTDGFAGMLMSSPIDIVAVLIIIATVVLIAKFKKSPITILIIMGCIGALLGV